MKVIANLYNKFNKSKNKSLSLLIISGILTYSVTAWAAGSITITPNTNLTNGQLVSISGSGLAKGSTGSIVECNGDPTQPTVTVAGNQVPVSCTNPLSTLVTTTGSGTLPATSFTVHTGTVGPPSSGNDSSGGIGSTDAAKYPCPPTPEQIAAGYLCNITFGDANNDDVIQNITFAGQTSTAPAPAPTVNTPTPSTTTTKPTITTPTHSKLTNTGPGNVILLFFATVIIAGISRYFYLIHRSKNTIS